MNSIINHFQNQIRRQQPYGNNEYGGEESKKTIVSDGYDGLYDSRQDKKLKDKC